MKKLSLVRLSQKLPAGSMLLPMLAAAVMNTFIPEFFTLGSYTVSFFSTNATIVLMYITLFYTGCQIDLKDLPVALSRGGSHVLFKYLAGAAFYLWVTKAFGMGGILGVCSLSLLCALTNCNSNLYMSLMETYGDPADMAARPMFNLNSGPTLSLVTIGVSGMAGFNPIEIISLLMPVGAGILLSALDTEIRTASKPAVKFIIPLAGFILGARIDLRGVLHAGLGGILLFVLVMLVTGPVALLVDRLLLKRPGYGGMATVSVAANTVAVPAMVAAVAPQFEPYVELATIQISAAVILSAFICPFLVHFTAKKLGCERLDWKG